MAGVWARLARTAPSGIELMLLLPDGTVMAADAGGNAWYRLSPDNHGSYVNGTWTTLASMHDTRLYYSSDVLTDGRVFVAGAEYGSGTNSAEVYDPSKDTWTMAPPPPAGQRLFFDCISKILPDGNILIAPVSPSTPGGTVIYNAASNSWTLGPRLFRGGYQDEASWVKLPDDSILTIDPFGTHSERYIPSLNRWVDDGVVPVRMYNIIGELGASFLLPDGRALFLGGTSHTAFYTPTGTTNAGTWTAGPDIPNAYGISDGAAAMLVNGKILCAVGSATNYSGPTYFFEFDSLSNSFASVSGPTGPTDNIPPFESMMLDLPDGSVLYSHFSRQLYVYQPDGSPLAAGKPAILGIIQNTNLSYHLTGTLLNGISEGAAYGDDAQMNSNYPLVRLTDSAGRVYYARTFNWSSTGVMTGNKPVTTEFTVPPNLPAGAYSLVVAANGISSDPVTFSTAQLFITAPPQPQTVLQGTSASFSVTVLGAAPLSYQWLRDGTGIAGATTNVYSIAAAQASDAGGYSVIISNFSGMITSTVAVLSVIPTVPLPFALNNSNLLWSTDRATPWYGQTTISHDGVAAAQTWGVGDNQQASLRTTVAGPGTLRFWWKVSSEPNADILSFRYGTTNAAAISGEVDWQQQSFYLPAGALALEWDYSKNAGGSAGQDNAWVDEISYTDGATLPFITLQPFSRTSVGGSPVTFTVAAEGTPSLSYQWRFDGTNIAGATSTSLSLPFPGASDSGLYSVRVSNSFGAIISADAFLGVVPLVAVGDDSLGQTDVPGSATNVIAIAAGTWHNLVLRTDGSVIAWGNNGDGQCDVPPTLRNVVGLAAGGYHNLALKADGTVTAWGANYNGQASPPAGLSNVIAVAAGTWHSLALKSDGTVIGWGDNTSGQSAAPVDLTDAIAIAAGGSHSLALRADGTVVAWGENTDAQGFYAGQSVVPSDLPDVVTIGAGDYHSLAVNQDGTVVVWGDGSLGQTPLPANLAGVVAVSGGGGHSLALRSDTTVAAWGNNANGQCNFSTGLTNVSAIAAGGSHSLLLLGAMVTGPEPRYPLHQGDQFSVVTPTSFGKNYTLEYKDSLSATGWTALLPAIRGNGGLEFLIDGEATAPGRFYRVRQW
jgi:hypothetical protein